MTKRFWSCGCVLLAGALTLVSLAGCAEYINVNGARYEKISDKQYKELIYRARLALYKNSKIVPTEDYVFAAGHEPEIKIEYTGDCYGTAKVIWKIRKRQYILLFEGFLGTDQMTCLLQVMDEPPDVIDFSGMVKPLRSSRTK